MNENLAWLTQKTEGKKVIKTLLFPLTEYMWLNCKAIKKRQPLISTSTPPFQVYPSFLSKNFEPPKWLNFWEVLPPPSFNEGGGGGPTNYVAAQTIVPEDYCPREKLRPGKLPPWMIVPGLLPQDNYPKIIASGQYPPGNCPRGLLFGWFVAYIITSRTMAPAKTAPQENCPKDKLQLRHFFPKNKKS